MNEFDRFEIEALRLLERVRLDQNIKEHAPVAWSLIRNFLDSNGTLNAFTIIEKNKIMHDALLKIAEDKVEANPLTAVNSKAAKIAKKTLNNIENKKS